MQNSTVLYHSKSPLQNIRFYNPETKEGDILFFINEQQNDIVNFLTSHPKGLYDNIVVPGIIPNFMGKKLSSNKQYVHLKKTLPTYTYTRIPNSKYKGEKTSIFDFSEIIPEINTISKTRSKKIVMDSFLSLCETIIPDYNLESKKCLFIYGDNNLSAFEADFIQLLDYYFKLNSNRIKSNFDSIVYFMNKNYYPLATSEVDKDGAKHLRLNIQMISLVLANKDKLNKNESEINIIDIENASSNSLTKMDDLRTEIKKLADYMEDQEDDEKKSTMAKIKKLVENEKSLTGTFEDKLHMLFANDNHTNHVQKVLDLHDEINDKYNGLIDVVIPQIGVFDDQEIVGLKTLSSFNKQYKELMENVDEDIVSTITEALTSDPDVDIKILNIKKEIIDDNKNRFKEFSIKIQHKDFGNTTSSPYELKFRTPVVVNDKYVKLGGNNYIMISQLFPQPIVKVQANLVRLFTNFSISHVELKNTKLNSKTDFKEVEQTLVNQLKALGKVKQDEAFSNKSKDEIGSKYGINDLELFGFKKLEITL